MAIGIRGKGFPDSQFLALTQGSRWMKDSHIKICSTNIKLCYCSATIPQNNVIGGYVDCTKRIVRTMLSLPNSNHLLSLDKLQLLLAISSYYKMTPLAPIKQQVKTF